MEPEPFCPSQRSPIHEPDNEEPLKTTATDRTPQGGARKAPARPQAPKASAKPLPRAPLEGASSPPSPAPADPFAVLVAGLAQLIEAHRASATSGPALALLAALAAILDLCRSYPAAPPGSRLMAGASDGDDAALGRFAGLSLVTPAPLPQASRPEPRLSPVHRGLVSDTKEILEAIDEACWHAGHLATDLEVIESRDDGVAFINGAAESLALLRGALHEAQSITCFMGAMLTGGDERESPGRQIERLALLFESTSPHLQADTAAAVRRALAAFNPT